MRYLSVCSGIEAATVAWHPLGWEAAAYSEIEAFPRAVLAHHYPDTPLHGDFTTIQGDEYGPVDLLVGGTPCQSFSIAGLRGGMDDPRGNLALGFLQLARRTRARWVVWENVPGVLSSNGGRDFGAILGGLAELGYGFAYRVLDAQFFGVAQRRRRVFVVGYLGDWRRAAAVLFERHSLSGHPAPRREAGKAAPTIPSRSSAGGGLGTDFDCDGGLIPDWPAQVSPTLNAAFGSKLGLENQHIDSGAGMFVAHTLKGEGFDASEDGTGRGTPIVPVAYRTTGNDGAYETGEQIGALTTSTDPNAQIIAFSAKDHGADAMSGLSPTLRAGGHSKSHANAGVMPAVAFSIMPMNSGKDFKGLETDVAQPVMAAGPAGGNQGGDYIVHPINPNALRGDSQAKTLSKDAAGVMRLRDPGLGVGADGDPADTLQAAGPGAVALLRTAETMYGVSHADASQTGPHQALRTMFEAAGEEAATQWCLGVLAAFWPAEVLRPEVHGRGVRCSAIPQRGLVNVALSRSQAGAAWSVQDLWEAGRDGRAPQGWRPHQQLAGQLGAYLSQLPYSPSPAQRLLHDMWGASEGAGLLREALSALQEARRSACGEVQSAHAGSAVRRLTVEECEALQGFPRSYTLIPYRKGQAADGPRYKALGNSMAVPVMSWIGRRIAAVDALPHHQKAAA